MKLNIEKASARDIEVIDKQADLSGMSVYGVAARCSSGYPQVIVLDPVIDRERGDLNYNALANILWITCPSIRARIEQMEKSGMITRVQQILHHDRVLATEMGNAHASFYYLRKEVYRRIMGRDYPSEEVDSFGEGIGGVNEIRHVKCLHIHYAHYLLSSQNIVGRSVAGILGSEECECGNDLCRN